MGLLSAESVWVAAVLEGMRPGTSGLLLGTCAGLAVAASIVWLTLGAIWVGPVPGRLGASLGASGVAMLGGYTVALVCAQVSARTLTGPVLTEDPPAQILAQDQLLYMFFAFLAIVVPAITFTEAGSEFSASLDQPLTYLAAPFFSFFAFTLRNNWDHWHRQQVRIADLHANTGYPADPTKWLSVLKTHMWFQVAVTVLITCTAVVPLMVLILSAAVIEVVRAILPAGSSTA